MHVYINIKNNTIVPKQLGNHIWPFETEPTLPLKNHGLTWDLGWDIPTRWALDNSDQFWEDNGHGHKLRKIDYKQSHSYFSERNNECG